MGILKETWLSDLKETLHSDAAFLRSFVDYSSFTDHKFIHIPQSGAAPGVQMNTNVFPLTASRRTDTVEDIRMDLYNTDPFLVPLIESDQLSYDKRSAVAGQHFRKLVEFIGDTVLQKVAPTAAGRLITIGGAKLAYADILNVAKQMDLDKVSKNERYLALPTDMFYELLTDEIVARQYANGFNYSVVESGQVLKVAGINIWERPQVATINGEAAGIGYQKESVCYGQGAIRLLTQSGDNGEGDPMFLGATMTAVVQLGAGATRTDRAGLISLARP